VTTAEDNGYSSIMKKHTIFIGLTMLELVLLALLFMTGHAAVRNAAQHELGNKKQLAAALHLTDLAIWTEARYTRHPSQTDFFSPFQDFPGALEHFPAGAIISPLRSAAFPRDGETDGAENNQP
jgi:hypothetical protein